MNIYFVQEARYLEYEGVYYSKRINYDSYWERYLTHFSEVMVIARVREVSNKPINHHIASGPRVSFVHIPDYQGPIQLFMRLIAITRIIRSRISTTSCYILRLPSHIGILVGFKLIKSKIPYSVEVVGDIKEVSKSLTSSRLISFLYGVPMNKLTKWIIKKAEGALYVTNYSLQVKYPPAENAIVGVASNVIIDDRSYIKNDARTDRIQTIQKRLYDPSLEPIKIGVIGLLYSIKSPLEIIRSFKLLLKEGFNAQLLFAGSGPLLEEAILLTKQLNISDQVIFLGNLPGGEEIRTFIDNLDIYVQFSKSEGLPRALIEAMARACPSIASDVGGIPELLPKDLLVKSGDVVGLKNKIQELLHNLHRIQNASQENLLKSKSYSTSVLKLNRQKFYSKILLRFQTKDKNER